MRFGHPASLENARRVGRKARFAGRFRRQVRSASDGDFGKSSSFALSGSAVSGRLGPIRQDEVPQNFQTGGRRLYRLTLDSVAADRTDRWQDDETGRVYEVVDFLANPDQDGAIALQLVVAELPGVAAIEPLSEEL